MMLKDVYGKFNSAVLSAHYRTNGLSTRFLPRAVAFGAGLAAGTIAIDSIADLLAAEQHDWNASADHVEIPPDYTRVSSEGRGGDYCYEIERYANSTEYHQYGIISDNVITVRHDLPSCMAARDAKRIEFYWKIGLASVATAIASVGGYLWYRQHAKAKALEKKLFGTQKIEDLFNIHSDTLRLLRTGLLTDREAAERQDKISNELRAEVCASFGKAIKLYYFCRIQKNTFARFKNTKDDILEAFKIK